VAEKSGESTEKHDVTGVGRDRQTGTRLTRVRDRQTGMMLTGVRDRQTGTRLTRVRDRQTGMRLMRVRHRQTGTRLMSQTQTDGDEVDESDTDRLGRG